MADGERHQVANSRKRVIWHNLIENIMCDQTVCRRATQKRLKYRVNRSILEPKQMHKLKNSLLLVFHFLNRNIFIFRYIHRLFACKQNQNYVNPVFISLHFTHRGVAPVSIFVLFIHRGARESINSTSIGEN